MAVRRVVKSSKLCASLRKKPETKGFKCKLVQHVPLEKPFGSDIQTLNWIVHILVMGFALLYKTTTWILHDQVVLTMQTMKIWTPAEFFARLSGFKNLI